MYSITASDEQSLSELYQGIVIESIICNAEQLIIGCALFDGQDYKKGFVVRDRVTHSV